MEEKNRSTVRIAGIEYTFSANASEEYIHKVALYVDKKMSKIQKERNDLSTAMIAVLAAVNIADELFKAQEEIAALKSEKNAGQDAEEDDHPPVVITGAYR